MRLSYYKKEISSFILFISLVSGLIVSFDTFVTVYEDRELIRDTIISTGIFAPLMLILLLVLANILMIIPNSPIEMVAGYVFGVFWGTVWNMVGKMIGATILFYMARVLKHGFARKHISHKEMNHFYLLFDKNIILMLFISRISMLAPNDLTNVFMGISSIKYKDFFWVSIIGYIPSTILFCMIGQGILTGEFNVFMILLLLLSTLGYSAYVLRHKIRAYLFREIRLFEEEAVKVEEEVKKDMRLAKIDAAKAEHILEKRFRDIRNKISKKN